MGSAAALPNARETLTTRAAEDPHVPRRAWTTLFARIVLFAACQALVALLQLVAGAAHPWDASVAWWPVSATVANLLTIALLARMTRAEGLPLSALWNRSALTWKRDVLWFLGAFVVLGPIAMLPSSLLAIALWGDVNATTPIMFQALPAWVAWLTLVLFPLSIAFSELPAYAGYTLPRLQAVTGRRGAMVLAVAAVLAAQHVALPLVFDWRFALWRALMYAPFALFIIWAIDRRPTLLPYFMGMHALIDLSVPIYVLLVSTGRL